MNKDVKKDGQNKIFGIFKRREPRELTEEEIERERRSPRNIGFFFKLLGRNFSKLLTLNFLMLLMVIPIFAAIYIFLQGPTTETQTSVLSPSLFGVDLISNSPAVSVLRVIEGMTAHSPAYGTPVYAIIAGLAVILAVLWGWINVGTTHVLRSMVRCEPIFMWSDFIYAIKRNLRQGFLMGLLDFVCIALLAFDVFYFTGMSGTFSLDLMFFCTVAICIIYIFMRYYLYLMLITFDLSIYKLLKNALIFTFLGIKRNIVASIGVILMAALNFILVVIFLPMGIIIPVILPLFYFLPFASFMTAYAAYPNIQKYMIDPQLSAEE